MRALAFALALAAFGSPAAEPPLRLADRPDLVGEAERALLAGGGYRLDDGYARLGSEPPLSVKGLAEALARLRARRAAAAESERTHGERPERELALKDAPALLHLPRSPLAASSAGERVRVTVERFRNAFAGRGPEATISVFDGPASRASAFLASKAATFEARPDGSLVRVSAPSGAASEPGRGFASPALARLVPAAAGEPALAHAGIRLASQARPMSQAGAKAPGSGRVQQPKAPPSPADPAQPQNPKAPAGRLASVFLSEDLLNAALKENLKIEAIRSLEISFDPGKGSVVAKGQFRVPAAKLRDLNLDGTKVPDFRFQVTIQPKTTKEGYLILVFPLQESFFYPADSKDPVRDRVVLPVQFLELLLASARGYLGVLSGDYSSFDRKPTAQFTELGRLDREIAAAKDPKRKEELSDERQLLALKLQAIPIERRQAQRTAEKLGAFLSFVSEREIRLNDDLSAEANTLILKLKLDKLAPFLKGIQLGGIRVLVDTRDGSGEKFLAIDLIKAVQ